MKSFLSENKIFTLITLAAIMIALAVIGGRLSVEQSNKSYDIVLDYQEMEDMSKQSSHTLAWWFEEFQKLGINKVGLAEETLTTITEENDLPVSATMMKKVMEQANWQQEYPADFISMLDARGFDEFDVMVAATSQEAYNFIADALSNRYDGNRFLLYPQVQGGLIVLDGTAKDTLYSEKYKDMDSQGIGVTQQDKIVGSKILSLSLGFLPEKVLAVESSGMTIIPRTGSYTRWNDTRYANAVIEGYQNLASTPEYLIVAGEAIAGNDESLTTIEDYVTQNNITLGLIEHTTQLQNILQLGLDRVVADTGYDAVRVFTLWNYIQNRYQYYGYEGAEEIENTLFRAVVERNIRVIYFKPIKEFKDNHVYITEIEEYQDLFQNLERRLSEHGMQQSQASVMAQYDINAWVKLFLGIGCVAAAMVLLRTILPMGRKTKVAVFTLGVLGLVGLFQIAPYWAPILVSFTAAVVFACFATVFVIKQGKHFHDSLAIDTPILKIIGYASLTLAASVAIALFGGMMTAAPISSTSFMMEIDIFRGVKLAQLLPLAFFVVAYLAYYGYGSSKKHPGSLEFRDLKDLMNSSVKVWMMAIAVLLAGIGYYYIARTGHDTEIMPSTIEMLFRNMLEDHLVARPRSKEFLFAFPAVMMLVYVSVRRFKIWPVIFSLASVIGLTSVVNTFMHIRTPLYLGFYRTAYSLLFGILIGTLGILIFEGAHKLYKRIERQYHLNE